MAGIKWEIGPVDLIGGHEAIIDAINEDQEDFRYSGRVRGQRGIMVSTGWHADGRYMYAASDHGFNLSPPPKKTVRVRCWINVDASGGLACCLSREDADRFTSVNRIACIEIDGIVTEGDGL